ncbi:DUF4059 family protein [Streptococcus infantis]|uniref:DUF4059 family protein n=1 Tax=Streptococcus infantis TaxID=68892 RepID=UPI0039C3A291
MLLQIFSLYFQSLVLTMLLVLVVLGLWIGLRALSGVDKTAKARQAHLYDMIMIGVLTIPVLSFATMSILLVLKA